MSYRVRAVSHYVCDILNTYIYLYLREFFRLRHEKLRRQPRDTGGPSHYQTLTCFDLEDTPTLPPPPASSIDDPLDFKV